MGFLLGFLTGLIAAIGGFGLLVCWICTRQSNMALARLINGIARALATEQPRSQELGKATLPFVNPAESRKEAPVKCKD